MKGISAECASVFFSELFPCMLSNYARRFFKNSGVFTSLFFQASFDLLHYKYFCHQIRLKKLLYLNFLAESLRAVTALEFSKWVMADFDSQAPVSQLRRLRSWSVPHPGPWLWLGFKILRSCYLLFCWGLANAYIRLQRAVSNILFRRIPLSRMNSVFLIIQKQMAYFCIKTNMYFSLRVFGIWPRKKFKIGKS